MSNLEVFTKENNDGSIDVESLLESGDIIEFLDEHVSVKHECQDVEEYEYFLDSAYRTYACDNFFVTNDHTVFIAYINALSSISLNFRVSPGISFRDYTFKLLCVKNDDDDSVPFDNLQELIDILNGGK